MIRCLDQSIKQNYNNLRTMSAPIYTADDNNLTINIESDKYPDYFVENGFLYYGKFHEDQRRLCLPKSLQNQLIDHVHDQAHLGHSKVTAYL